jgi:hypothetical protein
MVKIQWYIRTSEQTAETNDKANEYWRDKGHKSEDAYWWCVTILDKAQISRH